MSSANTSPEQKTLNSSIYHQLQEPQNTLTHIEPA